MFLMDDSLILTPNVDIINLSLFFIILFLSICLRSLSRLVVPCDLWSQLKYTILSTITSQDGRDGKVKADTSLWGADMTIVQSLPVLWDVLGEHVHIIVDPSTYSFNFPTTCQTPSIRLVYTFDHYL